MLQRTELTASQLNITQQEYDALLEVRRRLRTGEIGEPGDLECSARLNMEETFFTGNCGTVGCIAGWMAFAMHVDIEGLLDKYFPRGPAPHPLAVLFWNFPPRLVPVQEAVGAIDRFLAGAPPWQLTRKEAKRVAVANRSRGEYNRG
jgi:hypothetical protein